MSATPIRVLVVDDSAVVRGLVARAVEGDAALQLIGTAMHGEAALTQLRRTPADVVVLDVEMPVMDGLTALRSIQAEFPRTRVIMASALTSEGADITCRALALGAAGCIAKPVSASVSASIDQLTRELLPLIHALGAASTRTATYSPVPPPPLSRRSMGGEQPVPTILVIGTSTGGPQALRAVLCGLPTDFPLPIFIVQHMPPLFTPMLAKHLAADTGRPCQEAVHMEAVRSGHTYVAPGDYHLEVERREGVLRTKLSQATPEHYCRPSVNPLFRSAANCYGSAALGVMLTGMGEDGLEGSRNLVNQGGWLIAQDEATSVVWGMPGAVVRAGLANEVLPLDQIASRLLKSCMAEVV
ncbi:MAG: chemotaxis response regulator protein-glutamate methylesterase [Planctomycetaceae bacterium]|nr:chemotaxis response regulator protein-glutamate methylesterase [Planctomycetaceae bacterium]